VGAGGDSAVPNSSKLGGALEISAHVCSKACSKLCCKMSSKVVVKYVKGGTLEVSAHSSHRTFPVESH
jgi:hypothetical protein